MMDLSPELIDVFARKGITLIDEAVQDSHNTYPLVTYKLDTDTDNAVGSNIGYNNIGYTINVWAHSKADMTATAIKVDIIMKSLNFERTGGLEQVNGGLRRKIMTYYKIVREVYEKGDI
mgnify:CR=1 FL=1